MSDKIQEVLAWLDERASNSTSFGSHCHAYEVAARKLREAMQDDLERWRCGARRGHIGPEVQDCDWPTCGCDPYANKVIDVLEESAPLVATTELKGAAGAAKKAIDKWLSDGVADELGPAFELLSAALPSRRITQC